MHDYMIELTSQIYKNNHNSKSICDNINEDNNNQFMVNRIEAIIGFRFTLDKFHMEWVQDKEILKLFSTV